MIRLAPTPPRTASRVAPRPGEERGRRGGEETAAPAAAPALTSRAAPPPPPSSCTPRTDARGAATAAAYMYPAIVKNTIAAPDALGTPLCMPTTPQEAAAPALTSRAAPPPPPSSCTPRTDARGAATAAAYPAIVFFTITVPDALGTPLGIIWAYLLRLRAASRRIVKQQLFKCNVVFVRAPRLT